MTRIDDSALAVAFLKACQLDVLAVKPGNVFYAGPAYGMTAQDFIDSAEYSVPALLDARLTLGRRIEEAVEASMCGVGFNTNLGIVLLCAPLLQAVQQYPGLSLPEAVAQVLAHTTREDAAAVYSAIRRANPGGMGRVEQHDLSQAPQATLREVMASAAERDQIARQYSNDFALLFGELLPYYDQRLAQGGPQQLAASQLFLWLLSRHPDSHIARKQGPAAALRASASAADCLRACREAPHATDLMSHLLHLDREFKGEGLNPGTSADLCVATFLTHRLLQQAEVLAGADPDCSRVSKPKVARITRLSTSQPLEGDKQWL